MLMVSFNITYFVSNHRYNTADVLFIILLRKRVFQMAYHILIVDDEIEIITMLQRFMNQNNYKVSYATDGEEAIHKLKEKPDLILLDINMPQMDGIETCKAIREMVSCPILFLTARDQDTDKIEGFAAGGDDYITKPFSLSELKARIEAHLRRERRKKDIQRKVFGSITIDYSAREVFVNEKSIHFNRKEFDIIQLLSLNRGQTFERGRIYDRIWGLEGTGDDMVIMEHIRKIRLKFAQAGCKTCIETVWGIGYKWVT